MDLLLTGVRPGRPEAAAAIWTWKPVPIRPPAASPVRLRGCLQAAAGFAVAALFFAFGHRTPAAIVTTIATAIALAALLSPFGVFAMLERAVEALGRAIGQALTWILLPAVFYAFFAPFALLFRRGRRDSMKRYYEPTAPSYWSPRTPHRGKSASTSRERPY